MNARRLHELMARQILLPPFGLHVVGALWRRFVLRDVMARIIWPPA